MDIDDLPLVINVDLPIVAQDYVHRIGRTGRAGASGVAVSLVCADEAPQLAAIEALIRQTLPREEEPGFEAEHRVPQTSTTGGIIKKPKKPKQPKVSQAASGATQVPGKKPRPQGGENKRKPGRSPQVKGQVCPAAARSARKSRAASLPASQLRVRANRPANPLVAAANVNPDPW